MWFFLYTRVIIYILTPRNFKFKEGGVIVSACTRQLKVCVSHNINYFRNCEVGINVSKLFLLIIEFIFREVGRVINYMW